MAAITRFKALFSRRRHRSASSSTASSSLRGPGGKAVSIGSPTNFRREDITLGTDVDGNVMLVEQAREDAMEMHRASTQKKMDMDDGLRKTHARKVF